MAQEPLLVSNATWGICRHLGGGVGLPSWWQAKKAEPCPLNQQASSQLAAESGLQSPDAAGWGPGAFSDLEVLPFGLGWRSWHCAQGCALVMAARGWGGRQHLCSCQAVEVKHPTPLMSLRCGSCEAFVAEGRA